MAEDKQKLEAKVRNLKNSCMIVNNSKTLHDEKNEILKVSLEATDYQHLDDTSGRERAKHCYVNVLKFKMNDMALCLMGAMNLPQKHIEFLK